MEISHWNVKSTERIYVSNAFAQGFFVGALSLYTLRILLYMLAIITPDATEFLTPTIDFYEFIAKKCKYTSDWLKKRSLYELRNIAIVITHNGIAEQIKLFEVVQLEGSELTLRLNRDLMPELLHIETRKGKKGAGHFTTFRLDDALKIKNFREFVVFLRLCSVAKMQKNFCNIPVSQIFDVLSLQGQKYDLKNFSEITRQIKAMLARIRTIYPALFQQADIYIDRDGKTPNTVILTANNKTAELEKSKKTTAPAYCSPMRWLIDKVVTKFREITTPLPSASAAAPPPRQKNPQHIGTIIAGSLTS